MQGVKTEADGSVVVDGAVPIRDLNRALDWSLPDDEATTIAGWLTSVRVSSPSGPSKEMRLRSKSTRASASS